MIKLFPNTKEVNPYEHEKPHNLGTYTHEKSVEFPRFIIPQYWRGYQKINGSQERIKKKEARLKIVTDYEDSINNTGYTLSRDYNKSS